MSKELRSFNSKNNSKPLIGILGGCGPYATVDIENKILECSRYLLNPLVDKDYYPMIVYHSTQLFGIDDGYNVENKLILVDKFKLEINKLIDFGVKILLIACQSAHIFFEENLLSLKGLIFINMIETTVKNIVSNDLNFKKIGILGTDILLKSGIYQRRLLKFGINIIILEPELQSLMMQTIDYLNVNGSVNLNQEVIYKKYIENFTLAINYFKKVGAEAIILGCTELPLIVNILPDHLLKLPMIDPNRLSANRAVEFSRSIECSTEIKTI